MYTKIDWIGFTAPLPFPVDGSSEDIVQMCFDFVDEFLSGLWTPITTGHRWQVEKCRGFYEFSAHDIERKFVVMWGSINSNVNVQVSGKGCDVLRDLNILDALCERAASRVNRIDISSDFECDTLPREFVVKRKEGRIKGYGEVVSATGYTSYVGSRKSERFARVYRYSEPHPRAPFLRVEHECKGEWAKRVAAQVPLISLAELASLVAKPFGWSHPLWTTQDAKPPTLRARDYEKVGKGTLRWLALQVAPALRKLHSTNELDVFAWIDSVLDGIEPTNFGDNSPESVPD